jgi:hypothetical protein
MPGDPPLSSRSSIVARTAAGLTPAYFAISSMFIHTNHPSLWRSKVDKTIRSDRRH